MGLGPTHETRDLVLRADTRSTRPLQTCALTGLFRTVRRCMPHGGTGAHRPHGTGAFNSYHYSLPPPVPTHYGVVGTLADDVLQARGEEVLISACHSRVCYITADIYLPSCIPHQPPATSVALLVSRISGLNSFSTQGLVALPNAII